MSQGRKKTRMRSFWCKPSPSPGSEAGTPNPPRGANLAAVPEQDRPRAALHTRPCVCAPAHTSSARLSATFRPRAAAASRVQGVWGHFFPTRFPLSENTVPVCFFCCQGKQNRRWNCMGCIFKSPFHIQLPSGRALCYSGQPKQCLLLPQGLPTLTRAEGTSWVFASLLLRHAPSNPDDAFQSPQETQAGPQGRAERCCGKEEPHRGQAALQHKPRINPWPGGARLLDIWCLHRAIPGGVTQGGWGGMVCP